MASRLEASAPIFHPAAPCRRGGAAKTAAIYADAYHAAISDNMNLVARIVGTGRRQDVLLDDGSIIGYLLWLFVPIGYFCKTVAGAILLISGSA